MRNKYDHEERILQGPEVAILTSALIGTGTSLYGADQADKAKKKAAKKAREAQERAEAEAKRIADETRPEGESATIEFGTDDGNSKGGTASDFLVPKTGTSKLGTKDKSGLGE